MRLFEIIENQKKVIKDLKYKLQFSKNKVKDIETINTLIDTVNCFEKLMVDKYKTESLDNLLTFIIQDYTFRYFEETNSNLNLKLITDKIQLCLNDTSEESVGYLANSIHSHLITNSINNDEMPLKNLMSKEEIKTKLKITLTELKKNILWKKYK